MRLILTLFQAVLRIILQLPVSLEDPWSHYLKHLEDATTAGFTVKSLYVQIGVLHYLSLTIASVTGGRQTNGLLTLAMPHGRLFRINHYR